MFAVACLAAGVAELLAALLMIAHSSRFDVAFLAERDARRVLVAVAHPLPVGTRVDLGSAGHAPYDPALLEGWSTPESNGVWTDGRAAHLVLGLPSAHDTRLSVRLHGYVVEPTGALQDVTVEAGGAKVGRWHLPTGPATLVVPLAASPGREAALTVLIGRPVQPSRGGDPRALGFYLQTLEVSPD